MGNPRLAQRYFPRTLASMAGWLISAITAKHELSKKTIDIDQAAARWLAEYSAEALAALNRIMR
jgi:hypothetical protein